MHIFLWKNRKNHRFNRKKLHLNKKVQVKSIQLEILKKVYPIFKKKDKSKVKDVLRDLF